ncbi:MAG: hypothetical protein RL095_105 [Verrucomicrobiota bacterium]|jgi:ABC-type uncharacterized transport system permease subunit
MTREILSVLIFLCLTIGVSGFTLHAARRGRSGFIFGTFASLAALLLLSLEMGSDLIRHGALPSTTSSACWIMLAVYFFAEFRTRSRILGAFFLPGVLLLHFFSLLADERLLKAPAGDKTLVIIHVGLVILSFALVALACALGILYIRKVRALKAHSPNALDAALPPLEKLHASLDLSFNLGWAAMSSGILLSLLIMPKPWEQIGNPKIIAGLVMWMAYTSLFILSYSRQVGPRALARAATFLFAGYLLFFLFISFCPSGQAPGPKAAPKADPAAQEAR